MSTDQTPAAMPSEGEIFRQAMDTPSPTPSEPTPPSPPSPPPTDDRPRDELGRFVPVGEQHAPPTETTPAPPPPPQAPPAPAEEAPPPWYQREVMERMQAIDARNRQLEAAFLQMQQRQQQPQQPPPQPEVPDVITDPQGFTQYMVNLVQAERQQTSERLRNQEANFSFRIAHEREGELFEHAYTAMVSLAERGDPSVVRQVLASPDPGNAMINWFKRASTLHTVGDDPRAWAKEEIRKDPKFAAEVMEIVRAATQAAQAPGAPANVQLPPSLSRIPSTQGSIPSMNGMPSDSELFNYAFRQGR